MAEFWQACFFDPSGDFVRFCPVKNRCGKLAAEYSTTVASSNDAKVVYLTDDQLGSPRILTDANGAIIDRKDHSPFGEETVTSQRIAGLGYNSGDAVRRDFTGYEKESESGLEYAQARYYYAQHGRFTSADPFPASATIRNPQTFNRYSYVRNMPLTMVDPSGAMGCSAENSYGDCGGGSGFWGGGKSFGDESFGDEICAERC